MDSRARIEPDALPEAVARRWRELAERFEQSCQSGVGSGQLPGVDPAAELVAEMVRGMARDALDAIRRRYTPSPAVTSDLPPAEAGAAPEPDDTSRGGTNGTPRPIPHRDVTTDLPPVPNREATTDLPPDPASTGPAATTDSSHAPEVNGTTASRPPETSGAAKRRTPTVPGYEILGVLGRGGMGVVYKARQVGLNRIVALKMILAGEHASRAQLDRFAVEARAVAQVRHPGIVQIYEIGEHDGLPYFSLEFCPGGSLDAKVKREPQPPRDAAALVEGLARAMAAAHAAGVIHRDLKPANVLLDADGTAKVTDFGLARAADDEGGRTRTGAILGTPSFMSPEQAAGKTKEVGPAADQYSLGATLYDLLTGRPPFQGTSVVETLEQVRTREPVPPAQLQPGCPKDLETVCLKAMSKDAAKRYADCTAFADDLRRFLDGRPIAARPVGTAEKAWRWAKRNPRVAGLSTAVLGLLVLLAAGGTASAVVFDQQKREAVGLAGEREEARKEAVTKREEVVRLNGELKTEVEQKEQARKAEEENYAFARGSLTRLSADIPNRLREALYSTKAREEMLGDLADMLKDQVGRAATRGVADRAMLEYHHRLAGVRLVQGDWKGAVEEHQAAVALAERLRQNETRERDKATGNLALVVTGLGDATIGPAGAGWKTALEHYARAEKLQRDVLDRPETGEIPAPEAKQALARTLHQTADLLRRIGQLDRAADVCREAVRLREGVATEAAARPIKDAVRQLAASHHLLARIAVRQEKDDVAGPAFVEATRLMEAALKVTPDSPDLTGAAVLVAGDYADFLLTRGRLDDAAPVHDRLLALQRQLVETPEILRAQDRLALAYYRAGTLAHLTGETDAARDHYRRCLRVREQVADGFERVAKGDKKNDGPWDLAVLKVANVQSRLGLHAEATATFDRMRQKYPKARDVWFEAACGYGLCAAAVADGRPAGELSAADRALREKYTAQALSTLEVLVNQLGWGDAVKLRTDPDLAPIREETRFKAILKRVEERKPAAKK